jgi:hypothetical protein
MFIAARIEMRPEKLFMAKNSLTLKCIKRLTTSAICTQYVTVEALRLTLPAVKIDSETQCVN